MLLCSKSGFPQLILNIYDHLSQCTSIYIYIYPYSPYMQIYRHIIYYIYIYVYIYIHVYTYKYTYRKVDEMLLCSKSGFHHLILNIYIYTPDHSSLCIYKHIPIYIHYLHKYKPT